MRNKAYCVYKHTAPNGKVYIGITRLSVERRWQNGRNYKNNPHFYSAIAKYGWENIKHEVLFTSLTKEQAEQKEIELISLYKSSDRRYGYNIELGGNATGKISDETKRKMSESHRGKYYGNHRKHTEEEKKRVSEKLKGRKSPMKGKHWTKEQKSKVGERIRCVQTGAVFVSIREAARETCLDRANISRVLKGVYKQTGGLSFEYA